jgi:hypothetical protein
MVKLIKFPFKGEELAIGIVTCAVLSQATSSVTESEPPQYTTIFRGKAAYTFAWNTESTTTTTQKLFVKLDDGGEEHVFNLINKSMDVRYGHRLALIFLGQAGNATGVQQWLNEIKPEMVRVYNLNLHSMVEVRDCYWIYKHVYNSKTFWKIFANETLHVFIIPFLLLLHGCRTEWPPSSIWTLFIAPTVYAVVWCTLAYLRSAPITKSLNDEIKRIVQGENLISSPLIPTGG